MTTTDGILLVQAIASSAMCGLIWFVQVVHYPLFARVIGAESKDFAAANQDRTKIVVIPFMLAEGGAAAAVAWAPPPGVPASLAMAGMAIVIALWLLTACIQMPLHARLLREGHTSKTVAALVTSNWLRTLLWSLRGAIATWMLWAAA